MAGLREFFRSDAFVPTTSVFPPIDTDRLATDLALAKEGRTRGSQNQPAGDEDSLDPVEVRIVERVGDLRRKGLDTYSENVRVYNARLQSRRRRPRRSRDRSFAGAWRFSVCGRRMAGPDGRSECQGHGRHRVFAAVSRGARRCARRTRGEFPVMALRGSPRLGDRECRQRASFLEGHEFRDLSAAWLLPARYRR